MDLLLSLRGFRIKQMDTWRASMQLIPGFNILIDIRDAPASWVIQQTTPYMEVYYSEFKEPKTAWENASILIRAYQDALIDRSIKQEEATLEEPMAGNLPRTRKKTGKGARVLTPEDAAQEGKDKREAAKQKEQEAYLTAAQPATPTPTPTPAAAPTQGQDTGPGGDNTAVEEYLANEWEDIENTPGIEENSLLAADPQASTGGQGFPATKDSIILEHLNRILQSGPGDQAITKPLPLPPEAVQE